ncbi:unnamed protein product [Oppiella nova]|uniref:Protein kinase domain-containing protein n=1 Tax=Oppiella nova TaxID=334625 RepID=A0A7R9QST9_9ACAR|nr:unnamed protein product [Oppiella nova]CAG2172644.1 unnamed protein product [Oppiella nova]
MVVLENVSIVPNINIDKFKSGIRELSVWAQMDSDNFVQYRHHWFANENMPDNKPAIMLYILTDLCWFSLDNVINYNFEHFRLGHANLLVPIAFYISSELFIEILEAINYLHSKSKPIKHRSIQPSNILIKHHAHGRFVKLADFGLAIEHQTESQSHTQFPNAGKYMAPEVKQSRKYGLSSDVYSIGVLAQDLFNFDINKFE